MIGLDIVNEIRKLAQEQPDFVYEKEGGCKYTTGKNGCGCGVGQAIIRLDPDKRLILEMIDQYKTETAFRYIADLFIDRADPNIFWISQFQHYQDHRCNWKEAVKSADLDVN